MLIAGIDSSVSLMFIAILLVVLIIAAFGIRAQLSRIAKAIEGASRKLDGRGESR